MYQAKIRALEAKGVLGAELVEPSKGGPVTDDNGNAVPAAVRFKLRVKGGEVAGGIVVATTAPPDISLHLLVQDEEGVPHRSRPFELKAAGKSVQGTTSPEGIVDATFPRAPEAQLTVQGEQGPQVFRLQLGKLEPADKVLGAQQRLQSLGYPLRANGKLDDATKQAVAAFRRASGLPEGSELDADTSAKIDEAYREEMKGG